MANLKSLTVIFASLALVNAHPYLDVNTAVRNSLLRRQVNFVPTAANIGDFPDPALLNVGGTWFAYGTEAPRNITDPANIQVATSPDLISWQHAGDALPNLPSWVNQTDDPGVWAPDVAEWAPGQFSLLFSAFNNTVEGDRSVHCIGVATGNSPSGPFTPTNDAAPLICTPYQQGGAIDASHFLDPVTNQYYIAYKVDGGALAAGASGSICGNSNSQSVSTPILLQRLTDGTSFQLDGTPITLLDNAGASDNGDVEAPSLLYIPPQGDNGALRKRQDVWVTEWDTHYTTICPEESKHPSGPGGIGHPPPGATFPPFPHPPAPTEPTPGNPTAPAPPAPPAPTGPAPSSPSETSTSLPPPPDTSSPPPPSTSNPPPPSTSSPPPPSTSPSPPPSTSSPPSDTTSSTPPTSTSPPPPPANEGGVYILFFSPGCFADSTYATSYAVSTTGVEGPYERRPNLLVTGDAGLQAPGGLTAVGTDPSLREATWEGAQAVAQVVYHAGTPYPNGTRELYTGTVTWDGTSINLGAA